jgi:hypothetical protein
MIFKDLQNGDTFIIRPTWFMRNCTMILMKKDGSSPYSQNAKRIVDGGMEMIKSDQRVLRVVSGK